MLLPMLLNVMVIKIVRLLVNNKTMTSCFKRFLVAELTPMKQQVVLPKTEREFKDILINGPCPFPLVNNSSHVFSAFSSVEVSFLDRFHQHLCLTNSG